MMSAPASFLQKKIVFDFDGVLVRSRFSDKTFIWSKNLSQDLGISIDLAKHVFLKPEWNDIVCGRRDFRPFLRSVFKTFGVSVDVEEYFAYWLKNDLNWRLEIFEILNSLKTKGYELSVATNQDKIRADFIREQEDVLKFFNRVYASSEIGFCKPDSRFFEKVREDLAGSSTDLLLIDDDSRNVEAALRDGWQAIHFDPDLNTGHNCEYLKKSLKTFFGP